MPKQAMRQFKTIAETNPEAAVESIKRVCSRVSIEHASATREIDRERILKQVQDTLGYEFLNEVCREIIRNALIEAAGIDQEKLEPTEQWKARWDAIFHKMLCTVDKVEERIPRETLVALRVSELKSHCENAGVAPAKIDAALDSPNIKAELIDALTAQAPIVTSGVEPKSVPHIIDIKRAVAMMQRRIYHRGSPGYTEGTKLLKDVEQLARRFYGENSQLYSDIARQLSE